MTVEITGTRGVRAIYGTRETGGGMGVIKTEGVSNELTVDLSVESITGDAWASVKIPAGSIPVEAYCEVTEAFTVTGTTPTINVGTEGSEATNGVEVTEAQAEAVGAYDITASLQGTWTSPLAAETEIGVALSGTTPALTGTAGKARVTIVYKKLA